MQKSAQTPSNFFVSKKDIDALLRDKYAEQENFDRSIVEKSDEFGADVERLAAGEPLAYGIGWVPFLGLKIYLDAQTRPLIPRSETEWWTEKLIAHLKYKFEDRPFILLDLCAGSGAIGLAVLATFPNARISFGEIEPGFELLIKKNLKENNLDESRADIKIGNLFEPFDRTTSNKKDSADRTSISHFDIIATNPPYIPETRKASLSESVTDFEPHNALFSEADGLGSIKKIIAQAHDHLSENGELWMECDIVNISQAESLLQKSYPSAETTVHRDQYGRLRLLVTHFS
jgi:release factor glutamine methyltransferase